MKNKKTKTIEDQRLEVAIHYQQRLNNLEESVSKLSAVVLDLATSVRQALERLDKQKISHNE